MPKIIDSNSGNRKYVVGGRTKDRNVDDSDDIKQKQLIKEWLRSRRDEKRKKNSRHNKKTNS